MEDLTTTGRFDAPVVFHNPEIFAPTVPGRGGGFRGPYLLVLTPWFAAVADANWVTFGPDAQVIRHDGWLLDAEAADERIDNAMDKAAFRDSSFHAVSRKIDASDVQLAGARRVARAGSLMRICFQFPALLPRSFSAPRTDRMGKEAPGTIAVVQGEGGSCSVPAERSRKTDE